MANSDKRQLLVTASIIEHDKEKGKFLLTQRPAEVHNGGRWEFPGGKVEFGEDLRDCLAREIHEELGIVIAVDDIFEYSSHVYHDTKHVVLMGFHCTYVSGDIQHHEIADHRWVTLDEFADYDITEADLPFIEKLKEIKK